MASKPRGTAGESLDVILSGQWLCCHAAVLPRRLQQDTKPAWDNSLILLRPSCVKSSINGDANCEDPAIRSNPAPNAQSSELSAPTHFAHSLLPSGAEQDFRHEKVGPEIRQRIREPGSQPLIIPFVPASIIIFE